MSTPADNTRLKTGKRNNNFSNPTDEDNLRKLRNRSIRCEMKAAKFLSEVQEKNELVKQWLSSSNKIQVRGAKVNLSIAGAECMSVKNKHSKPAASVIFKDNESEVCFNMNKLQYHQTSQGGQSTYKDVSGADEGQSTIGLGCSAMSGNSSASIRRKQAHSKLQQIASKHGMLGKLETQHVYAQKPQVLSKTLNKFKPVNQWAEQSTSTQPYQDDIDQFASQNRSEELNFRELSRSVAELQESEGRNDSREGNALEDEVPLVQELMPHGKEDEVEEPNVDHSQVSQEEEKPNSSHSTTSNNDQSGKENSQDATIEDENIDADFVAPDVIAAFKERLNQDDRSVFYDMFELLITKLSCVQNNIHEVRETQNNLDVKVNELQVGLECCGSNLNEVDNEVADMADTNIKLIQAMIKSNEKILTVRKEVEKLQENMNKGCFILNGVNVTEGETAKQAVTTFCSTMLNVETTIRSAHKMGNARHAPIWFQLDDPDNVAEIFKATPNLKDKVNQQDKPYILRQFTSEKRKHHNIHQQDVVMENKRLPDSHKVEIAYQRGDLYINEEKFATPITVPSLKDALLMNKQRSEELEALVLHSGEPVEIDGSLFESGLAKVSSLDEVQKLYHKLKNDHISATHVMCGFRLFGSRFYELQSYKDDDEYGGGRCILEEIRNNKLWNVVVFIVRYHNGPNLGKLRFETITKMTQEVIASFPGVLNYGQHFRDNTTLKILNKSAVRPQRNNPNQSASRGRGNGRGQGRGQGRGRGRGGRGSRGRR